MIRIQTEQISGACGAGNIRINRATVHAYSAILDGNRGEEQLILVASPGQDGNTAVAAVVSSCDGGCAVATGGHTVLAREHGNDRYGNRATVETDKLAAWCENMIIDWLGDRHVGTDVTKTMKFLREAGFVLE